MKRIAFPFVGDTLGGSHVSTSLLMQALPEFGFDPIALLHHDGPLADYLADRKFTCEYVNLPYLAAEQAGLPALARLAVIVPQLALQLRRGNFALVHANDGRMIAAWMPAGRLAGVASVAHRRTRWTPSRLAHLSLRAAQRIIAISDYVQAGLPTDLASRSRVINNPFTKPSGDRAVALSKLGFELDDQRPLVGFVGTLQAQKRPDVFVEAAAHLINNGSNAQFVLVGRSGDRSDALRSLVTNFGITDRVTFSGFQPDAAELIAGFDLLLAPAINEGHGRTLVEAMLAGVPVIAADSGGHREIVAHGTTGLLVPPDDAVALSVAAETLLSSADHRHRLIRNAQDQAAEMTTPRAHAEAVAAVYNELLAAR